MKETIEEIKRPLVFDIVYYDENGETHGGAMDHVFSTDDLNSLKFFSLPAGCRGFSLRIKQGEITTSTRILSKTEAEEYHRGKRHWKGY